LHRPDDGFLDQVCLNDFVFQECERLYPR
jgi:hypothetical protein